jgi:vancomycin resistance protein VanJ
VIYVVALLLYLALRLLAGDEWWWLAFLNNFTPYYFLPAGLMLGVNLLLGSWRMVARLLPVLIIALVWFGPRWLPKYSPVSDQNIKVITFNILTINDQAHEVAKWLRASEANIILLQELDPQDADYFITIFSDTYFHDSLPGNQLTLSTYPVLSSETIELAGWWVRRLVVDIEGQLVAVYNIHLALPIQDNSHIFVPVDNGFVQLALKYNPTWRDTQTGILLEVLAEETLPYIVAGDFNTSDQSIIYNRLVHSMNDAFLKAGIGLGATWPTSIATRLPESVPPFVRIDYIWHSDELRSLSAEVGPSLGSDHLPLSAALALND